MARTRPFQSCYDPSRLRPARAEENEQYRKFIANLKLRQAAAAALAEGNAAASRAAAAGALGSNTKVAASAPSTNNYITSSTTQPQLPARTTRLAAAAAARAINAIANPKASARGGANAVQCATNASLPLNN